jgi:cytochrome c peroxidase
MLYALLSILFLFPAEAKSDLDLKLSQYIKRFQLAPLEKPQAIHSKLAGLGHTLFTDRRISGNRNISCMDCHHPRNMTMDGLPLGLGEGSEGIEIGGQIRTQKKGKILARNTPSLFNLDGIHVMFWDGRVSFNPLTKEFSTPIPLREEVSKILNSALAAQAIFPLINHEEMRGQKGSNEIADAQDEYAAWDAIVKRIMTDTHYRELFSELFPNEKINIGHVGVALAEFQRAAFALSDTPYDSYLKGDLNAMNDVQKLGMDIFFGKGKCGECHNGPHLSNFEFHNVGTPQFGPGVNNGDDFGRFQWDEKNESRYAFRVPPLRNVAMTAPYMHDGAFKTLPQVIEHYDMIIESLSTYKLINNWKNYFEKLTDHDHATDQERIATLSAKLTFKLHFEEEEEKALNEFLSSALLDKKLASREIDGAYETYFRMQLKTSGYEKLNSRFNGKRSRETFYYFDSLLEGGFFLRELAQPIRLLLIERDQGTQLIYREQVFKTAVAQEGVILGGNLNRDEKKDVSPVIFTPLKEAYLDLFDRIYTYKNEGRNEDIPLAELSIIRRDAEAINHYFHQISFRGADRISDVLNQSKEEIFFVPTSFNTKETNTFSLTIQGKNVNCILQRSVLRTETGALETTWAIEFETEKILKADLQSFGRALINELKLGPSDVGGTTPSPSKLTLEILEQALF